MRVQQHDAPQVDRKKLARLICLIVFYPKTSRNSSKIDWKLNFHDIEGKSCSDSDSKVIKIQQHRKKSMNITDIESFFPSSSLIFQLKIIWMKFTHTFRMNPEKFVNCNIAARITIKKSPLLLRRIWIANDTIPSFWCSIRKRLPEIIWIMG